MSTGIPGYAYNKYVEIRVKFSYTFTLDMLKPRHNAM